LPSCSRITLAWVEPETSAAARHHGQSAVFGWPKSANDNAQNQKYPWLDNRIATTYAAMTDATNKNSLYDSYIKAFRWSSDRLDPQRGGIICFVSNGAWLDGNSADGLRKSLAPNR
jgi:predicted helicase